MNIKRMDRAGRCPIGWALFATYFLINGYRSNSDVHTSKDHISDTIFNFFKKLRDVWCYKMKTKRHAPISRMPCYIYVTGNV